MREIILVSHGTLAQGMIDAVEVILGTQEGLSCCCLNLDSNVVAFERNITSLLLAKQSADELIILADLQGGSPYSTTLKAVEKLELLGKTTVIGGMNLPLVLAMLLGDADDELNSVLDSARSALAAFNVKNQNNFTDIDELL